MTLPEDFIKSMAARLGQDEYSKLEAALLQTPPTSIRLNPSKADNLIVDGQALSDAAPQDVSAQSSAQSPATTPLAASPVPWCHTGLYLSERPRFTFDPLFHAGCYYVQEASSMYVSHILHQFIEKDSPVKVLDLCAAPGGKSTLALSLLPEGSLLIANEAIRSRANILAENIIKWGKADCIVTNNYADDFSSFADTFDIIICDAPCSGEGMFRKDHDTIGEWSLANVHACQARQKDIASKIWHTLKEGGILIYSTCTYNPIEDEDNVRWIAKELGAEILSSSPDPTWGIDGTFTHFYPHITKGEGFFVSVLRKKGEDEGYSIEDEYVNNQEYHHSTARHSAEASPVSSKKKKNNKHKKQGGQKQTTIPSELKTWIEEDSSLSLYQDGDTFKAFPSAYDQMLQTAKQSLRVIHAGISIAKQKGKNMQPCHSLAMSLKLRKEAFPRADLKLPQAIAYLSGEAIQLDPNTPAGYVLLTYQGHPLGFAKNIGTRANNLYPAEWKIRSSYRF